MPAPIISGPKKPKHSDASSSTKDASAKRADAPIINPEADRILGRMTLQTVLIPFVGLMVLTFAMPVFNQPKTPLFKYHQIIDIASSVIVLTVWYALNARLFAKRLEIGRELVGKREWKQAVVCLEPFNSFGQRFLDRTGEAHYLLAQAYAGAGKKADAEKCRNFVVKNRPGTWAAKLGGKPAPSTKGAPVVDESLAAKPKPPKAKPKRRF